MKITEYTKINRKEVEYTVDGIQRVLEKQYIELCVDLKDCHIIQIENEKWIGYYDTGEEIIYIDPLRGYPGITKKVLGALTQHLGWNDYTVYVRYCDYGESVLAIQKED